MDIGSAIVAGIVATVVMTALMYMAKAVGMPMDMPRMLGLMFSGPENSSVVYALGAVMHLMMGIVFAVIYALVFEITGADATWLWGAVLGAIHGGVAGLAFGMMPMMHPRMGNGQVLAAPGMFGKNYAPMMPAGVIMLHMVFGLVVGILY
jgi:hypothetical protein